MTPAIKCACVLITAFASATAPLLSSNQPAAATAGFDGWPSTYEGRPLTPLPLSAREQSFAEGFPGRIARFSDGRREIILRHVAAATRRLHPASDCYKGLGFDIEPLPLRRDANGQPLGCFTARKGETRQTVCEGLRDTEGAAWSDVSQWYWEALFGQSRGPWWSIVVAQIDDVTKPENPDP